MANESVFEEMFRELFPEVVAREEADISKRNWADLKFTATEIIGKTRDSLAGLNTQFIEAESAENVRRATLQFEDLKNQVIGIQSSSGFLSATGTSPDFVAKMEESFQAEIDYINASTRSRMEIAFMEGLQQADAASSAEDAQRFSTGASIIGAGGTIVGLF